MTPTAENQGSTLVGLLVGMAIGLLIVGLGIQSLTHVIAVSSRQATRNDAAESQRVASRFLGLQARAAGGLQPISLSDRRLMSPDAAALLPTDVGAAGAVLNVAHPDTAGVDALDCLGRQKAVGGQIQSSFWVSGGSLRCRPSSEAANQPLSNGWSNLSGEAAVATPNGIQWVGIGTLPTNAAAVLGYRLCLTATQSSHDDSPAQTCADVHRNRTPWR